MLTKRDLLRSAAWLQSLSQRRDLSVQRRLSRLARHLDAKALADVTVIAAKAAERRRSRFVNIFTSPHAEWGWFSGSGCIAPASIQVY